MASICADFPYDVNDDPTEDWTMEQVLHWCLLKTQQKNNCKRDELIDALQKELEAGKAEIWSAHEMAVTAAAQKNEDPASYLAAGGSAAGGENINPNPNHPSSVPLANGESTTKATAESLPKKAKPPKTVHVEITNGPYAGSKFVLKPRNRSPCFVGRSAGKKFRERGISMPKDSEVSTTHGKFEFKSGKMYFTDTGSTNGTLFEGKELEDNVPLELKDGMVIQVGASSFNIRLGYA